MGVRFGGFSISTEVRFWGLKNLMDVRKKSGRRRRPKNFGLFFCAKSRFQWGFFFWTSQEVQFLTFQNSTDVRFGPFSNLAGVSFREIWNPTGVRFRDFFFGTYVEEGWEKKLTPKGNLTRPLGIMRWGNVICPRGTAQTHFFGAFFIFSKAWVFFFQPSST